MFPLLFSKSYPTLPLKEEKASRSLLNVIGNHYSPFAKDLSVESVENFKNRPKVTELGSILKDITPNIKRKGRKTRPCSPTSQILKYKNLLLKESDRFNYYATTIMTQEHDICELFGVTTELNEKQKACFEYAINASILNYLLKDQKECERLILQPFIPYTLNTIRCPVPWSIKETFTVINNCGLLKRENQEFYVILSSYSFVYLTKTDSISKLVYQLKTILTTFKIACKFIIGKCSTLQKLILTDAVKSFIVSLSKEYCYALSNYKFNINLSWDKEIVFDFSIKDIEMEIKDIISEIKYLIEDMPVDKSLDVSESLITIEKQTQIAIQVFRVGCEQTTSYLEPYQTLLGVQFNKENSSIEKFGLQLLESKRTVRSLYPRQLSHDNMNYNYGIVVDKWISLLDKS